MKKGNVPLLAILLIANIGFCSCGIDTGVVGSNPYSENYIGNPTPLVTIRQGKLAGLTLTSRTGRNYYAFLGIPFAEVRQRFEPPFPPKEWEGVRSARDFGPICPQLSKVDKFRVVGVEDCLVLNVYTPKLEGRHPVVLFLHGGAYQFGTSNDFGGSFFTDEDTILVTSNYRLNALGFLSTADEVIQGNMGFKDQIAALKWIQDNIEQFGGDITRITLMGTSAGAAGASFNVLSPMSKGLFHRVAVTSGSVLNPWSVHPSPLSTAQELAEALYCPTKPSSALAECLRNTDFRKIVEIKLSKWHVDPLCQYGPVIEKLRPGQTTADVFLAEDPLTLLSEGRFNKVPTVTGFTEDEGLLFHSAGILKDPELQRNMNEDWNNVAPITLMYDKTAQASEALLTEVSRKVRGFYFGNRKVNQDTSRNLTNLYSDRWFIHGIKQSILLQAQYTPVYPFILGFHGDWSILNLYYGDTYKFPMGVSHGDDMQYFFDSSRFPRLRPESTSEQFSKTVVKLWASFAKTGNVMESMGSPNVPWMPVSLEDIKRKRVKWYFLDLQPRVMVREPFQERLDFWDSINAQLASASNTIKERDSSSSSSSNTVDYNDKEQIKDEL